MGNMLSTSLSGLMAAQTALSTISHNVANVNTPGYARQSVTLNEQNTVQTGYGFIGSGVSVTGIQAQVSSYLDGRVAASNSQASYSKQLSSLYGAMQSSVASSNGLSSAIASFNSAITQASGSAESIPARQLVLSTASSLATNINSIAGQLSQQKDGVNQNIKDAVSSSNVLMQQIAKLNQTINSTEPKDASGVVLAGSAANDLRAQRTDLINQLSSYMNITTVNSDAGVNVYAGGVSLVDGVQSMTLVASAEPGDPSQMGVGLKTANGTQMLNASGLGGSIGASSDFISKGLNPAKASLDQLASGYATIANEQLAKGLDLNGNAGAPLFSTSTPTVADSSRNTGSLSPTVQVDPKLTQGSDYKLAFSAANGYALTRLSDNTVVASGAGLPLTGDGLSIDVGSGAAANGDSWLIRPFGDAASNLKVTLTDPKQLAFASALSSSAATANTSNASITAPKVTSALPLDANLNQPVNITFTSATEYTISGTGIGTLTNQPYTPGSSIAYNGWSTSISGTPDVGDSFSIGPNGSAPGDSANINALTASLANRSFNHGKQSLADLVANAQSLAGTKTAAANAQNTSDQSLLTLAKNNRENYSGVNLDEEAASLAKWQQIYSANAQVMSISSKLFDELLSAVR